MYYKLYNFNFQKIILAYLRGQKKIEYLAAIFT
jgi:hypothetical protein